MSASIVLNKSKYVQIAASEASNSSSRSDIESLDEFLVIQRGSKKRRLDHLSWEEKLQRK